MHLSTSATLLPASFQRLSLANLAAQSAEQISLATVPLVALLLFNATVGDIGLLTAMGTLPFFLLSLPLGVLADRMPRQRLMLWGEALRLSALLLLWIVMYSVRPHIGWLAVLSCIGAIGTVAFSVATPGLVYALVPRTALAKANAQLEVARSAAFAAGPTLAGALVAWMGGSATMGLAVLLSACAVVALQGLRADTPTVAALSPRHRVLHPMRHLVSEIVEGAGFARSHALLRPILLTGVLFNLSWFVLQTAYASFAIHILGFSATTIGFTLGCYGVGMLLGALATPYLITRLPYGRAIQIGPLAGFMAAVCLVATLWWPGVLLAGLCFFLLGSGPMVWTITTTTLRQSITPNTLLGRVSSVFLTANAGARPIGAAVGGWIGMGWGESTCLWIALLGFAAQALVIVYSPISRLKTLPAQRSKTP